MKITNIHNLPDALVNVLKHDEYPRHDQSGLQKISATELLSPPQLAQLKHRHSDEIVVDVSKLMWATLGKAVHNVLHQANVLDVAEQRLEVELDGAIITGQFDLLKVDPPTLIDYKVTSVYSAASEDTLKKWSEQLNIYHYLAFRHHLDITDMQVVAFLRDFGPRHKHDKAYPDIPIQVVGIDIMDLTTVENKIKERIALHKLARELPDERLPICSHEEQWRTKDTYKIRKTGRKSSVRNLDTLDAAIAYGKKHGFRNSDNTEWKKAYSVEFVPGEPKRCNEYCDVKEFCFQYKQEHHDEKQESSDDSPRRERN